ncbi:MAG TPA: membrane protein insertion efficiency factor YidD [Chlamydiales bacterium]|nr:membrane protein insertion efficiency factor YidD [Chlamydiales bacterium]
MFRWIAIQLIKLYRLCISPLIGSCCRFSPTCSQYALEAFEKNGFWKGLWMTLKRLSQCHPWGKERDS